MGPLPPVFNTVAGPATTTQQMRIPNDVSHANSVRVHLKCQWYLPVVFPPSLPPSLHSAVVDWLCYWKKRFKNSRDKVRNNYSSSRSQVTNSLLSLPRVSSGAQIKIAGNEGDGGDRLVTITGSPEAVGMAQYLINSRCVCVCVRVHACVCACMHACV